MIITPPVWLIREIIALACCGLDLCLSRVTWRSFVSRALASERATISLPLPACLHSLHQQVLIAFIAVKREQRSTLLSD